MDVDQMMKGARDALTVKKVFGDPIEKDGVTLIPAARVAGGGGGGSDTNQNGGGGFGVGAKPAGALVIKDGKVSWQPAVDVNRAILGAQITAAFGILALRSILKKRRRK